MTDDTIKTLYIPLGLATIQPEKDAWLVEEQARTLGDLRELLNKGWSILSSHTAFVADRVTFAVLIMQPPVTMKVGNAINWFVRDN